MADFLRQSLGVGIPSGSGHPHPSQFDNPPPPPHRPTASGSSGTPQNEGAPKARRAFKACAHCRSRKAKCDLGDLNNPHDPPCTRCRREGVLCEFLPSRRGGRVPFNSQKKRADEQSPLHGGSQSGGDAYRRHSGHDRSNESEERENAAYEDTLVDEKPTFMGHVGSLAAVSINRPHDFSSAPAFPPTEIGRAALRFPPAIPAPPPISSSDIFRHPRNYSIGSPSTSNARPQEGSEGSPAETASEGRASEGSGMPKRKKRRLSAGGPVDAETLAAANLRNPVDALDLLVLAADSGVREAHEHGEMMEDDQSHDMNGRVGPDDEVDETTPRSGHGKGDAVSAKADAPETPLPRLEDFPLVKNGVLTPKKLCELVDTEAQLAKFASQELHLTTVFVVIASRHDRNPKVHDKSWAYLQTLINDIILGKAVGVGAVEALLLLSEYLPRQTDVVVSSMNAEENRMSWMLVGTAVRLGYMLGLDQKTLLPAKSLVESTTGTDTEEMLNRERVAWTYCYLFDRQISVRTGKAFWSRGPGLCFTGGSGGVHPSAAKNFPALRFIPDLQDDFASLLQAYVELTQIMTSSHDILYPSRERTISLIKLGEYYKYIDEFQRSLEAFRMTWEGKRWATYPLTECIWITFHYLRLYIYAFAFQAHITRSTMYEGSDDESRPNASSMFPAGLVASPDAKFILEAIDAAADLLRLVTDRLHPGGALPFLPWRFYLMFSYAGVFLLKAVYCRAVAPLDRTVIVRLLKRLIFVLACASTDEQHPGVRYARLLNGLLRAFSQGEESLAVTRAATPLRRNSVSAENGGGARTDLDFMAAFVGGAGASSVGVTPAAHRDDTPGQEANQQALALNNYGTFNSNNNNNNNNNFNNNTNNINNNINNKSSASSQHGGGGANVLPGPVSTPFPMLPFSESQPFHQLANALDSSVDVDFGFEDPALLASVPAEAFNFLLEDSALDFWSSFDGNGD